MHEPDKLISINPQADSSHIHTGVFGIILAYKISQMKKTYYSIAIAVMTGTSFLSAQTDPTPWNLNSAGNYSFTSLSPTANSLPSGMAIHQMGASPTTLTTTAAGDIPLPCAQTQANNTNVWGLGVQGIGIKVNPSAASTGYTAGRSFEVLVAVNTTGRTNVKVSYKAGSYQPGGSSAAVFRLRCQYRVGSSGSWSEMPGGVSEYQAINPPDSVMKGPYTLPSSVDNQAAVQVRWVYYYVSGTWSSTNNRTQRVQLDDISITSKPIVTLPAFAMVCPTSGKFTLSSGTPAGGTYSGTGVGNGNSFNPAVSGVGTFPITYSYTDPFGNSNSATQNITVDYNGCVTQLGAGSCGVTVGTLHQTLSVDAISGASNYQYQLTDNSSGAVYTYTRGNSLTNFQLDWLWQIGYGKTYSVRVATYINNAWTPYGSACSVTTPAPPATQLTSGSCGTTISSLDSPLYCDVVDNAGNYRYEVTDVSTGAVTVYTRGNWLTNLQLDWLTGTGYSKTYSIRVASNVGGTWLAYGSACTVNVSGTPLTQLANGSCGITESAFNQVLNCKSVAGASNYRYEITDVSNGNIITYVRGNNLTNLQFDWIASMQYGKTYSIRVASFTNGIWSAYGTACSVTTPAPQTTQLQAAYCGISIPSMSTPLYIDAISSATDYMYEITNLSTGSVIYYPRGNWLTNFQFDWITGLTSGPTYSIRVAASVGGVWLPYGAACTIATSGASPRIAGLVVENNQSDKVQLTGTQSAKLYPNPNKGLFTLETSHAASVRISNLLGVAVYNGSVTEGVHSIDLSMVEPGVYLVQVYDGKNSWLMRMVKE